VKQIRYLFHERDRSTNERQRCGVMHDRLKFGATKTAAGATPGIVEGARHGLPELNSALACQRDELVAIRELISCPRAIEQTDLAVWNGECVAEHRAKRGDADSPGDEREAAFYRVRREHEGSSRSFNVNPRPLLEPQEPPGVSLFVDPDEQLEPPIVSHIFGRRGNGIRAAQGLTFWGDENRLARGIIEGVAGKIEPDDPRSGRGRQHFANRQREEHS
jgi:hypothetical protein